MNNSCILSLFSKSVQGSKVWKQNNLSLHNFFWTEWIVRALSYAWIVRLPAYCVYHKIESLQFKVQTWFQRINIWFVAYIQATTYIRISPVFFEVFCSPTPSHNFIKHDARYHSFLFFNIEPTLLVANVCFDTVPASEGLVNFSSMLEDTFVNELIFGLSRHTSR